MLRCAISGFSREDLDAICDLTLKIPQCDIECVKSITADQASTVSGHCSPYRYIKLFYVGDRRNWDALTLYHEIGHAVLYDSQYGDTALFDKVMGEYGDLSVNDVHELFADDYAKSIYAR